MTPLALVMLGALPTLSLGSKKETPQQRLPGRVWPGGYSYPPGTGSLHMPVSEGDAMLSSLGHSPDYAEDLMRFPNTNKAEPPGTVFFELTIRHRKKGLSEGRGRKGRDVVVPFPCPITFSEVNEDSVDVFGKVFQLVALCHARHQKPLRREEVKQAHYKTMLQAMKNSRIDALSIKDRGEWDDLRLFELAVAAKVPRVRLSWRFDPTISHQVDGKDLDVDEARRVHQKSKTNGVFPRVEPSSQSPGGMDLYASPSTTENRKSSTVKVEAGRFFFTAIDNLHTPWKFLHYSPTNPSSSSHSMASNGQPPDDTFKTVFQMDEFDREFSEYSFVLSDAAPTDERLPAIRFELKHRDKIVASTIMAPRDWQGVVVPRIGNDVLELIKLDEAGQST